MSPKRGSRNAGRVQVRPATLADARFLFELRNDPVTRAASFRQGELRYRDHVAWLTSRLAQPERGTRVYVALLGKRRVGQVRFDVAVPNVREEIAIAVARSQRGRGLGGEILTLAATTLARTPRTLARIKPDNLASLGAFQRAGFRKSGPLRIRPGPHVVLIYRSKPR